MKKNEVKMGRYYTAKVSGNMATIRIDAENPHGGWDATNITTGKKVGIKSVQRLRRETRGPGEDVKREADIAKTVNAVKEGDLTKGIIVPTGAKKAKKATKDATPTTKCDTAKRDAKGGDPDAKRLSGLDAAAQVLAEAGEPLNTKEVVERMLAEGLWKTNGKTPAATIYAAMIREIAAKGDKSRFRKIERGRFTLAK